MKIVLSLLTLVLCITAYAGNIPLLILAGQSNMRGKDPKICPCRTNLFVNTNVLFWGSLSAAWSNLAPPTEDFGYWGPEMAIGPHWRAAYPTSQVAIIKTAIGATNLENDWSNTGSSWQTMTSRVATATNALLPFGYTGVVAAIFWQQGESDAFTNATFALNYTNNFTNLIARLRTTYGASLPFVYGRISYAVDWTNFAPVYAAQTYATGMVSNIGMVSLDDLWGHIDSQHYDGYGTFEMGVRMFNKFTNLTP